MRVRRHNSDRVPQPRRAAATVEMALVLPILTYLFVAAADFSRVFYYSLTISNCARNGAVYASDESLADKSPYTSVEEAVLADAVNLPEKPTVTTATGTDAAGNDYVDVTVVYPFKTITNYPGIPRTIDLKRKVRMRLKPDLSAS